MITFKLFLEESQNYPLYHATSAEALMEIISSNTLKRGYQDMEKHWPAKRGEIVSLTRNLRFARSWANLISDYPVVIQLNRGKIRNRYKIVPYNYFDDVARRKDSKRIDFRSMDNLDQNQYEEALVNDLTNVLSYIEKIFLNRNSEQELYDNMDPKDLKKIERFITVNKNL